MLIVGTVKMGFQINILMNIILEQYFSNSRCILVFSDNAQFTYTGSLPIVQISVSSGTFDDSKVFGHFYGCQGIAIFTNYPMITFQQMEMQIKIAMDRFNERKYVIISQDDNNTDLLELFNTDVMDYIADIVVIKGMTEDTLNEDKSLLLTQSYNDYVFNLYTHSYVGINGSNEVIFIDEWHSLNKSFGFDANLFPNKMHNHQGRKLRIATFTYEPYSVPATKEGTEMELALEYAAKYNMTAELVVDEVGEWGEIYDNWTGYGILGNLLYDRADFGLGALYTWGHEHGFLDLSKPVVRTGITCIAPKPTLAGGWLIPFISFSLKLWIAVMAAFICCSIALFFLNLYKAKVFYLKEERPPRFRSNGEIFNDSVMQAASVFLLQALSVSKEQRDKAGKYLFSCMFILTIVISTSYSGGLASSMTVPRYTGDIKTVQDLVDSGIQWGATSIAWIMSIIPATDEPNYVTLVHRFVKTTGDVLTKYNNKRFAFSVERLPAGYFAIGNYVTEKGVQDLRLMNEDLYWEQCVIMTKKSSIHLPQLDMLILRIQESGISKTWEYRVATQHMNAKVQAAVKYSAHHTEQDSHPVQLKLMHVEGAFGILIIGIILATICFISEIRIRIFNTKLNIEKPK